MITYTPFGVFDKEQRTLRISPAMFAAYKDMELRNSDTHELDQFLDRMRPFFGIGEIELIVEALQPLLTKLKHG